ncbi:MAG: hypothetical protein V8S22_01965 [Lachnospiraceae bacterium]
MEEPLIICGFPLQTAATFAAGTVCPGGEETVAADQERYLNLEEVLRVCRQL